MASFKASLYLFLGGLLFICGVGAETSVNGGVVPQPASSSNIANSASSFLRTGRQIGGFGGLGNLGFGGYNGYNNGYNYNGGFQPSFGYGGGYYQRPYYQQYSQGWNQWNPYGGSGGYYNRYPYNNYGGYNNYYPRYNNFGGGGYYNNYNSFGGGGGGYA